MGGDAKTKSGAVGAPHAPIRHPGEFATGQSVKLDAAMLRSLLFREINVSEAFTLCDAKGRFFRASLQRADDRSGVALVYEEMAGSTESPARITLVCAVLARQRMITVVQKAAELGCVRVVPVVSAHSVRREDLDHEKPWAWPGQALKGARQCRRASVPLVTEVSDLAAVFRADYWRAADVRLVLDDRASASGDPLALSDGATERDVVLAVGPEGGWSDDEQRAFSREGALALVLGSRVLRAETAVFAGLSVVQHRLGDLR